MIESEGKSKSYNGRSAIVVASKLSELGNQLKMSGTEESPSGNY